MNLVELRQALGGLPNLTDDEITQAVAASNGITPDSPHYAAIADQFKGYNRTWGQALGDTAIAGGQAVLGLGKLAGEVGGAVIPGVHAYDNPVTNFFGGLSNDLGSMESQGLQNRQASADRNIQIAAQRARNSGASRAGQLGAEAKALVQNYWDNPQLALQDAIPLGVQFLAAGGAGKLVQGGAKLLGLGDGAARVAGTAAGVGGFAKMQGAAVGQDTYDQARAHGASVDQASEMAGRADAKTTAAAAALSFVPGGATIERSMLGGATLPERFGLGRLGTIARTTATESVGQGASQGYGTYARNQELQQVNPGQDLWQGVGAAAAQGALTTAPMALHASMRTRPPRTETGEIDLTDSTPKATPDLGSDMNVSVAPNGDTVRWPKDLDTPTAARGMQPAAPGGAVMPVPGLNVPTAQRRAQIAGPVDQRAAMAANEMGPQAPGRFVGPQYDPASMVDLAGQQVNPMQTTPATMADLYRPAEPVPFTGLVPDAAAPAAPPDYTQLGHGINPMQTTPATMADLYRPAEPVPFTGLVPDAAAPAAPPDYTQLGHGINPMQTTPATMADLYKPVEPEPFTGIAPTPAAPAGPTKGDVLVALRKANQALGARAVRKDGEVANTAAAAPLREVLQSATPLETMRDLYGNGGHPRDELLDTWHKNLTGQTIPEWQESHPPEPKTNSAGFVPEPQGQLQAQVDAVREGRKPAVVLGVGEAKGLNLDGLHQGVATDPTTRRRAVVVAATPDVVKAAVERTKAVGLKQAMGEALGNANPTLTTQTAPDAAVVQHVDNTTGHVLNEQLARPQDAANIQPVPGTTPRVVSPDQALAERQAGTEAEKPTAKPPRLGRKSTEDLIALAESTKDDATYDAARYEMFKRWATDSDEGMSYAYLHDKANKSAITPAEQAAFTDRYNAELEAKVARKGQALGKKFDASVREPVSPVTDESGTVGEAASRAQEPSDDPYAHITQRENTTAAQQGVGRDVLASLERTVRGERDGGNAHVVAEPGNGEDGGALERANNPTARVAEGRPDTTGGHPRPAATGITERVLGPERAHDSNVLGMRLLENFREKGGAQLVGQHVESGHDLAAVSQVYRDPRFETFRVIYTDPTGRVVGEAGYTSRLPGVAAVPPDLPALIGADKQRFGAQEFYILHNHPSGVSTPSRADVDATRVIAAHIPGFRQHVIIDHNEYSVINANGDQVTYPAPHLDGVDFTASPALAHPLIGQRLESIPHVVDIAKQLQTPNGYATLVALDANRHINLLADIPLAMVKDNTPAGQLKLNELVRRAIAESGAGGDRFIVLPHGENIGPALGPMTRGLAADIVNADGSSARLSGLRRSEDFFLKTAQPTRVLESAQSVPLESAAVQEAEKRTFTKPFSDATRTVTAGVVAQARSEEIHPALLSAMTLRQIDQQYGKKLPALRPWIGSLMERGAAASRISAKADRVALQWEQSVKSSAERKALADVLLRESLAELNLNNTDPKYIASLEPEQRAEYHTLRAKLATLSPEAREIRTKAHEVLREQWSYTREALGKFISQTVADPAMRAERLKGLDDLMGRNRGNYFPLSRFGDRIVVARGAAKDGRDIVSFHESAASVEQEVRRLKAEGVSPRDITVTLRAERDPSQRPTAGFLGELHAMVDHADMDTSTREDLHEALQQLYLKSLPELSGAKHMIRRQNIEGYSQDALRSFADAVTRGSRYAAHLEYAPAIHAAAESAESQSQSAEKRQVAVVVGRKDGQAPVVRVTPVGVDRLEAAKQLARDGYAPEFFNTTVEGARERLAGALEGVPSEQIDKFVDQVQALAQRRPDGVEDLRAAKALYNRMIKLQQYHGTDSLDKVVDALGKVGYTWYLGFSPSFWAMNMLQNPMIGIPHLGARYGVTKTSVEWLNAARWFAGVRIGKRLRDATTPFSIEWLRDQVKAGELKGISKQELDMLQQLEDRQVLDFTQAMDLSRIGKASSGTAYKFLRLAAAGAHHTEVFNRVTFALAAYRLALKSSADITHEEAVRRAEDDVAAAHFDYSFANKPAMMRGKSRLVFMFQQYRQHMLYWWGNTIKDMVKGETPEDRGRALKAALLMGAAQGIFAGAMGLPFVGTIGQLANMFASDNDDGEPFDFKRWITQAAVDATGSQKAGEVMANGIFAAVGADVSRRIGQADLLPLINMGSKSYAQHTDDKVRDYLFDLLGPLGSIAVDAAKSVDMFSSGQTLQGLAAASPQAAKGIIQAYALDTEGLKNKRGQVLATADKFDGSDRAMQLLGVKPMDVTHVQADRGRVLDAEYYFKQRAQILEQSFVQAWTRQDDKGMSDALDGIKEFNNKLMKGNLATKSNMVTGQKLESALKTYMQQQMMLALSNGAAASRQELMMAMRMSGLYNPVALGATPTALPGNMPGLPGLP